MINHLIHRLFTFSVIGARARTLGVLVTVSPRLQILGPLVMSSQKSEIWSEASCNADYLRDHYLIPLSSDRCNVEMKTE